EHPDSTKAFLQKKLAESRLNVSPINSPDKTSEDLILFITCDLDVLQAFASQVYVPQQLRRQSSAKDDSLSIPEQERILLHILESIIQKERSQLVGLDKVTLYPGQSIVQICHREQVILHYFPLHQINTLKALKANLCSAFVHDIDSVRNYFGEKIGFYYSFLNFYSAFFIFSSVLSFLSYTFGHLFMVNESITVILCISLFVFLKLWKRESNRLATQWGTIESFELETARPAFRSKGMQRDPVTDQLVPFYPIIKTWFNLYLISVPFVLFCLFISFEVMCLYFATENMAIEYYNSDPGLLGTILSYCPSITYAVIVMIMNHFYRHFATRLNDYENHRTQTSHENHWIVKLVLFEFFNSFLSLFYIAFYLKDINMLRWNLMTMLTINQLVDNFLETFLPLSTVYLSSRAKNRALRKEKSDGDLQGDLARIHYEKELCEYEDTYYDYLELFIQYGMAFLFFAIFPLAPVIAAINSILEVRLDAFKLCVAMRKPRQRSAKSVNNAWMKSFEVISMLVVISNLLVLSLVSQPVQELSDVPKEVNVELSRQKYRRIKGVTGLQVADDHEKKSSIAESFLN
ncbi:hypothetical protein TYRP_007343, partial [Tyrophagus putrescentiae]